jgi:hypothetical protein
MARRRPHLERVLAVNPHRRLWLRPPHKRRLERTEHQPTPQSQRLQGTANRSLDAGQDASTRPQDDRDLQWPLHPELVVIDEGNSTQRATVPRTTNSYMILVWCGTKATTAETSWRCCRHFGMTTDGDAGLKAYSPTSSRRRGVHHHTYDLRN